MVEQSRWIAKTLEDPNHSNWYIERFRAKAAAGEDLGGEARFVHALAPPAARILDAGCGPGRVGGALFDLGHDVVGVDVDPALIAAAEQDHPGPRWLVGDLAELDLARHGIAEGFDAIVCAGNVMTFLAPSTRREVLARLGDHLGPEGRLALGFGAGRDYPFDDFFTDVAAVGLIVDLRLATWDLRPFDDQSEFLVSVLRRPNP
ncbi:MAG: class I SAM-dependent methyltransferase [Acidimicrobiales bacterium]